MKRVRKQQKKEVNSLSILAAWSIWKYRNDYVLKRVSPSINTIRGAIKDDLSLWGLARLRGYESLISCFLHQQAKPLGCVFFLFQSWICSNLCVATSLMFWSPYE